MGHTYKRRHDVRARINAAVKKKEREQRRKEARTVSYQEDALQRARTNLIAQGGLITVALGRNVELPPRWQQEPRVYPLRTAQLDYDTLREAMPSNTRIVILTDHIPGHLVQPIHREIQKRHLNYLVRKSPAAVDDELARWLPTHEAQVVVEEPPPAPPPDEPPPLPPDIEEEIVEALTDALVTEIENGTLVTDPAPTRQEPMPTSPKAAHGSITAFVLEHGDFSDPSVTSADEARRLFQLAKNHGVTTTVASLAQIVGLQKKQRAKPTRPPVRRAAETARPVPLLFALDAVMTAIGQLREAAIVMTNAHAAILRERDQLQAKVDRLSDAFKKLAD